MIEILPFTKIALFQLTTMWIMAILVYFTGPAGLIRDRQIAWWVFVVMVLMGIFSLIRPIQNPDWMTFNFWASVVVVLILHAISFIRAYMMRAA